MTQSTMFHFHKKRLQISGGFLLLIAWFTLESGWIPLLLVLSAAAIHELGHFAALRFFGAPMQQLKIGLLGAVMTADRGEIGYGQELITILAGPLTNLIFAAVLTAPAQFAPGLYAVIGSHLALGLFNLLPIRPLDGGQALELLLTWKMDPTSGEQIARVVGAVFSLGLSALLFLIMGCSGGNLWLAPPALALLAVCVRELFGCYGT